MGGKVVWLQADKRTSGQADDLKKVTETQSQFQITKDERRIKFKNLESRIKSHSQE